MIDLAIYDMDRTVTRRATYTPFLLHCALRRSPWRLLLLPFVILSMLAYVGKLIDRGRLKEINHRLLLGHQRHPAEFGPWSTACEAVLANNVRPGAREGLLATGGRKKGGDGDRQLPLLPLGNRRAAGLTIALHQSSAASTNAFMPRSRRELLWAGQAPDDRGLARQAGLTRAMSAFIRLMPATRLDSSGATKPVACNPQDRLASCRCRGWQVETGAKRHGNLVEVGNQVSAF